MISGNAIVAHTYRSQGTYTILATATDSFGNVVNASSSVAVNPRPQPTVTLTGPTTPPTAGTDTQFTGSVAPVAGNGSVITNVVMDYGDGTVQNLGAITGTSIALHHVYAERWDLHRQAERDGQQRRRRRIGDIGFRSGGNATGRCCSHVDGKSGSIRPSPFTGDVIGRATQSSSTTTGIFGDHVCRRNSSTSNQTDDPIGRGSWPITVSVSSASDGEARPVKS